MLRSEVKGTFDGSGYWGRVGECVGLVETMVVELIVGMLPEAQKLATYFQYQTRGR